jgi:hypothetical protein
MRSSCLIPSPALFVLPFLAIACGAAPGADPASSAALSPAPDALAIAIPAPPRPVPTTDGHRHLLYELVLQNTAAAGATVNAVEVFADGAPSPLASYTGDQLAPILLFVAGDGTGVLAPGGQAVAFIDLALSPGGRLPRRLINQVRTTGAAAPAVSSATTDVVAEEPIRIGPPLRGADLINFGGCCASAHTRALLAFPDGLFLAQRYAIDFVRVDVAAALAGDNPLASGDPTRNESYFTFGNEIVAVRSGRIAAVRDGMAENVPGVLPPPSVDTAAGNYVIEDIGDGRFALYAHMQPGSLRVHAGEWVRRGDVLGLVGNTGNSSMPHLHFHVMDRASALDANGLPYVFDRFDLEATVDLTADNPQPAFVPPPQDRRRLLPMTGDLLAFPGR